MLTATGPGLQSVIICALGNLTQASFWNEDVKPVLIKLGVVFLAGLLVSLDGSRAEDAEGFVLLDSCPPGFQLMESKSCKLRSLYQLYPSLEGEGVGGL